MRNRWKCGFLPTWHTSATENSEDLSAFDAPAFNYAVHLSGGNVGHARAAHPHQKLASSCVSSGRTGCVGGQKQGAARPGAPSPSAWTASGQEDADGCARLQARPSSVPPVGCRACAPCRGKVGCTWRPIQPSLKGFPVSTRWAPSRCRRPPLPAEFSSASGSWVTALPLPKTTRGPTMTRSL